MSITELGTRAVRGSWLPRLSAVAEELASLVVGLDVAAMDGAQAAGLAECFARIDRLAVAGVTLAAGRVGESGHHRVEGFPTAQQWLADRTKANAFEAARTIETAGYLASPELGPTRDALVAGTLTATQANEIATAATNRPEAQGELLALACRETVAKLRAECRRIRLADNAPEPPKDRAKAVADEMAFSHRDLGDGMSEVFARMPTSWAVLVLAAVRTQCEAVFAKARAAGRDDSHQAYMVEALVTLLLFGNLCGTGGDVGPFDGAGGGEAGDGEAGPFDAGGDDGGEDDDDHDVEGAGDAGEGDTELDRAGGHKDDGEGRTGAGGEVASDPVDELHDQLLAAIRGGVPPEPRPPRRERRAARRGRCRCGGRVVPRAKIIVRTDMAALLRGHTLGEEVCDIAGVGPVPVATVRELWPDALIKAVVTRGMDVVNVTSLGRRATEAMATAMQWANPSCSNIACDNDNFVEIDHRLGYANVGRTRLDELDGLCSCCHGLKTNENWQLVAGAGRRRFVPPGHPDHPGDPATPRRRAEAAADRRAG